MVIVTMFETGSLQATHYPTDAGSSCMTSRFNNYPAPGETQAANATYLLLLDWYMFKLSQQSNDETDSTPHTLHACPMRAAQQQATQVFRYDIIQLRHSRRPLMAA